MSLGANIGQPMGPIEAGFRAAHKARRARLFSSAKARAFKHKPLYSEVNHPLSQANEMIKQLVQENADLRAKIARLNGTETDAAKPMVRCIIAARARQFGISYGDIIGRRRNALVVEARHAAMHDVHLLRPDLSYPSIARMFGNRDHTTIIHGVRRHKARIDAGTARARPLLEAA